eukprot:6238981-Pyramimonas_sp.AAC.1
MPLAFSLASPKFLSLHARVDSCSERPARRRALRRARHRGGRTLLTGMRATYASPERSRTTSASSGARAGSGVTMASTERRNLFHGAWQRMGDWAAFWLK